MNIELCAARAPILASGAFCLAAAMPWLLSLPPHAQAAACAAIVVAAWSAVAAHGNRVRRLHIETHGGLTATLCDRDKRLKVLSVRVPRLLSFYAELVLQLDDGGPGGGHRVSLFVLPRICGADAFRRLRIYLMQKEKESNFIRCATM